jgi:hypothetical protein
MQELSNSSLILNLKSCIALHCIISLYSIYLYLVEIVSMFYLMELLFVLISMHLNLWCVIIMDYDGLLISIILVILDSSCVLG